MLNVSRHGRGASAARRPSIATVVRAVGAAALAAACLVLWDGPIQGQSSSRFRFDSFKAQRIRGISDAQSREFSARIADMHKFLGSLPDVNDPRPPECSYVYTNTESGFNPETGSVAASSVIGFMASAPGGPCPKVDEASITFRINDVRKIYQCPMHLDTDSYCMIPELRPGSGGFLQARGRNTYFLLLRSTEPLLVPETKEGYLRAWEKEYLRRLAAKDLEEGWGRREVERIRAALAALPPEKRSMQACRQLAEPGKEWLQWDPGTGECAPGMALGKPNPRIVRGTPSPVDIESVLISTTTGRTVGVSVEVHAHKERALRNFDFEGLARVLMR